MKNPMFRALFRFGLGYLLLGILLANPVLGQEDEDEERKLPEPEDITLESRDGVTIAGTYWEPKKPGKNTVPIILLHGWEGKRHEYDALGRVLQERDEHAVVSIDLRGHGGSKIQRFGEKVREIDPERMIKRDFEAMIYDVHAAKKFLVEKHNEGKCNIELLTIVGADMGAIAAMRYATYDWTRPVVAAKVFKQGQDVKGLVLLSPPKTFKGVTYDVALKQPTVRGLVSTMIIVGAKDRSAYTDAKSLHSVLSRFHVKVPGDATPAEKREKMDLFLIEPQTTLQGTSLLSRALKTDLLIKEFIDARIVANADQVPWMERQDR